MNAILYIPSNLKLSELTIRKDGTAYRSYLSAHTPDPRLLECVEGEYYCTEVRAQREGEFFRVQEEFRKEGQPLKR